jgi:hypothetical protein
MIGLCQEGKSSPDALRRSAGVNSFGANESKDPMGPENMGTDGTFPFVGNRREGTTSFAFEIGVREVPHTLEQPVSAWCISPETKRTILKTRLA